MEANKWIPADQPPNVHDDDVTPLRSNPVLVHRKSGKICVAYYEKQEEEGGLYEDGPSWITDDSEGWNITSEVTHWMPLPSPPEITK